MPSATPLNNDARHLVDAREFPIVLVTGGSGYIGSHTVLEILKAGCAVVVVDNLVNSHVEALHRVYHIAKDEFTRLKRDPASVPPLFFHQVDVCDQRNLYRVFHFWQTDDTVEGSSVKPFEVTNIGELSSKNKYKIRPYEFKSETQPEPMPAPSSQIHGRIIAVVHFAALKAVGESVSKPLQYYRNNIGGLINLLDAMMRFKVHRIVFSSSAVVYGTGKEANISEDAVQVGGRGTGAGLVTNPYGRSKWMAEEILNDYCIANSDFECIALRYFNPTGSHPSGLIGEDPKGTPNNIVPVILQTYQRRRSKVYVYGSNYDTWDGTGVRDYIHVSDLAAGHLAALRSLLVKPADRTVKAMDEANLAGDTEEDEAPLAENYRVYNLGTGHGYSVLDIIRAFASASGQNIPFAIQGSRSGDLGTVTAATEKAARELGWQAHFDIQDMCRDVYTFAQENPQGYERLRKFSVMALQDPTVMRRVSVAAGLMSEDIGSQQDSKKVSNMLHNYMKLSKNAETANNIARRMSVISEDSEADLESAPGAAASTNMFPAPNESMFGDFMWSTKDNTMRKDSAISLHAPDISELKI